MKREKLFTASKLALAASLLMTASSAMAGIANTKHNLGSNGTGTNKYSGTAEICVFCHTPHGADTSASVPLWNKTLADPTTYTTYASLNTTSLDGATAPVGSVSIACLSCHDGTQAMDSVLNEPGSGAVVAAYSTGQSWTGPAAGSTPAGSLNYATASIVNLEKDLSNDHPVGIQYGGGNITSAAISAATKDPDFKSPDHATVNTNNVWWVDTEATPNGTRQKTDMLLYTRSDLGPIEPFVECASCHDPHTENTTFLRISNDSSAVCLGCHIQEMARLDQALNEYTAAYQFSDVCR